MGKSAIEDDPLALAIAPPADETPAQREERLLCEAEARRIRSVSLAPMGISQAYGLQSDEIDEQIRRERDSEKRKKKPVKLLLLGALFDFCNYAGAQHFAGQAEAGKTGGSFVQVVSIYLTKVSFTATLKSEAYKLYNALAILNLTCRLPTLLCKARMDRRTFSMALRRLP